MFVEFFQRDNVLYGSCWWNAIGKVWIETLTGARWYTGNKRPVFEGIAEQRMINRCIFMLFLLFLSIFWTKLWRSLLIRTVTKCGNHLVTWLLIALLLNLLLLNRLGKREEMILFCGPNLKGVISLLNQLTMLLLIIVTIVMIRFGT